MRARYCSTCWRTFEWGDWQLSEWAHECYGCQSNRVTPEQRHAGFMKGIRETDTPSLIRWAQRGTGSRAEAARQVLAEREAAKTKAHE